VLEPGGHLAVSITHPLQDAGAFDGDSADAPFVVNGSYLGDRRRFEATFERDGLTMAFAGWCYPLEAYTRAFETAGLLIERVREPRLPDGITGLWSDSGATARRWDRIPMFLWFRALKPLSAAGASSGRTVR
jgi:hypothetical protein